MLSKHVSMKEGVYSTTAKRLGLDNTPTEDDTKNMELICEKIFEPLRAHVQHCHGQAMDIDDKYSYMSNADMYKYIKRVLDFDQMIWEFGDDDNPDWIHVSYVSSEANRNRCLKAYRTPGSKGTKYMVI